jgi:aldose 1-epimerase
MSIEKDIFGKFDNGSEAEIFTLSNQTGIEAKITSFGATLVSLKLPDRNGKFADVVLGYDALDGYVNDTYYFGCTAGRVAGRISNAKFELDGKVYKLAANLGKNHIHGGLIGFNKVLWASQGFESGTSCGVTFNYSSPDGQEGYPGDLDVSVKYTLTDDNELKIYYEATASEKTVVNLTNHSYFNLAGHNGGSVLGHKIQINADRFTELDKDLIPTGRICSVEGTPFDLRQLTPIGQDIGKLELGYDLNFVLNKNLPEEFSFAAKVAEPQSGRVMEIFTTEPAIQFYTGNFLDGVRGKAGAVYKKHEAFCLETQHFPDSPNRPDFPSVVLSPGEVYRHLTVHKFSVI